MASDPKTGNASSFGRRSWIAREVGKRSPKTSRRNKLVLNSCFLQHSSPADYTRGDGSAQTRLTNYRRARCGAVLRTHMPSSPDPRK